MLRLNTFGGLVLQQDGQLHTGPASGMPIWPVGAWVAFAAADPRHSFAAEPSGTVNWRSGVVRVAGLVSAGDGRDTPVDHRMRIDWPGLHGTATLVFHRPSP